ncbi:MAG: class I SAM-dependent methyltransferase [Candidatus Thorarchaeota archaeon]
MNEVNTAELYNDKYCARIDAKGWRFKVTPQTVKIIYDHFKPESVIDVGCANGLHLKAFRDLGVERLLGIEGTPSWAPYIKRHFGDQYIIADLRRPLLVGPKFDLVFCMEVLEHIEEEFADQAVKNLCSFGHTICCSACPVKGGFHHLNPQPKEYWIEKFEKQEFKYCSNEVDLLQSNFQNIGCSGWYKTGLKVFRKIIK